jgi:hypothetical protein
MEGQPGKEDDDAIIGAPARPGMLHAGAPGPVQW